MSGVVSFRWPVSITALQEVVGDKGDFLLISGVIVFSVLWRSSDRKTGHKSSEIDHTHRSYYTIACDNNAKRKNCENIKRKAAIRFVVR